MNTPISPEGRTSDLIHPAEGQSITEPGDVIEQASVAVHTEQVVVQSSEQSEAQQANKRIEMLSYYSLSRRHL